MVVAAGIVFICISGGGKPPTYLLQGASLLSSCTRTLAVFQYSKPETLERKARPSNPVARPTDRPTSPHPSARPPTLQCTPNRHIWTKSNRILSKRFPRPIPFHRWSEAICTPFFNEGRPSSSSSSSTPLDGEMEAVSLDLLSLSFYLSFPFFGERRFGN